MRMATAILTLLVLTADPYQLAVTAALADLATVPPASQSQCRYVLALTEDDLPAVSFVLASVSRTRVIRQPKVVGNGVLRIQLATLYGTDGKAAREIINAWEELDEAYFGTTPGLAQLQLATNSAYPIMRADAFVAQVAGESEHYYRFSGVPAKRADLEKSIGLNITDQERVRAELNANLFVSKVTGKPRRIIHYLAPFGSVFVTQDVDKELPGNSAIVPADVPKGYEFVHVAEEWFWVKSNGAWGTGLFARNGDRQAAVPSAIATDSLGSTGHGEIVPLVSCLRCHERFGSAGMQPFKDAQVIVPSVGDRDEIQKLTDAHDPDRLTDAMTAAGITNIKAISRVTQGMVREGDHVRSMIPEEATNALVAVYESFVGPVDLARAASEKSVTEEQMRAMLATSRATGAYGLLAGEPITRAAFEEVWRTLP